MENASDAIIMAGAILIFVIALSTAMIVFTQARITIDTVVYASDRTNYYDYLESDGAATNIKNRVVGLETIIPTLYKYYKENYTVVFLQKNGTGMKLYETKTRRESWSKDSNGNIKDYVVDKYPGMRNTNQICSFDVNEELIRREPWVGSPIDIRNNLEAFLVGGTYEQYTYDNNGSGGFIKKYSDSHFRETIGEYSTSTKDTFASELNQGIRDNKNKRVIVYQLID